MDARTRLVLIRLAPFALLCAHAAVYGGWIVDDAAITFAYARSFVAGQGFVTWPGAVPVEGFSNLAWLLCLSPFLALGLFDPVWTPKLLGLALTCVALALLRRTLVRSLDPGQPAWLADAALAFVVANPAVVIWCVSGLENPLYLFAVTGIVEHATRTSSWHHRAAAVAAMWALLAATTRPDGLSFAAVWPVAVLLEPRAGTWLDRLGKCALHLGCLGLGLAAVTAWRELEFGDFLPNTARVKLGVDSLVWMLFAAAWLVAVLLSAAFLRLRVTREPRSRTLDWLVGGLAVAAVTCSATFDLPSGARGALRAMAAPGLGVVLYATALTQTLPFHRSRTCDLGAAPAAALACSLFVVGALPPDWMGEQRFATPMLVLGSTLGVPILAALGGWLSAGVRPRWVRALTLIALSAALAVTGYRFVRRAHDFASDPTVPMQQVQAAFEATFVTWAADLAEPEPTVLIPDVGGALWSNRLPILDLGGLCDARIAKLLARGDREALAELILTDLRPGFIGMHGHWAWFSGLHDDPRFERDYVPVWTEPDARLSRHAGRPLHSGRYVRRDLDPGEETRDAWRRSARAALGLAPRD